jgi:pimeloyl-ACP methyl ester carboxylesterase
MSGCSSTVEETCTCLLDRPYREVVITRHVVASDAAPANPTLQVATPSEYNQSVFLRFRHVTPSGKPAPAKAILILVPGFLGSANDFLYLGRRLVQRSQGAIEVWALDRRSNLLEDHTGFDAAERAQDPKIARDYYFGKYHDGARMVDGQTFAGFKDDRDLAYMSEWGLDVHLRDIRALVNLVPEADRKKTVFVGGHSLGGWLTERFAAWDFDGDVTTTADAGYNQVAGLVMLDGGGQRGTNITAGEWRNGYTMFGFPADGADGLRAEGGTRAIALGPIDKETFVALELIGLYADMLPQKASDIFDVSPGFGFTAAFLFGVKSFHATNEAVFGFAVDNDTEPVSIVQVTAGKPVGGAFKQVDFDLAGFAGTYLQPADPAAFYTWQGYQPAGEITDLNTFARMMYEGPADFIEWYFPARLSLDLQLVQDIAVPVSTGTLAAEANLHFAHLRQIDAPVFAVAAGKGIRTSASAYDDLKGLLPPARGKTTPRGGDDFTVVYDARYTHIDVLAADDETHDNAYFGTLSAWLLAQSRGDVTVGELP